MYFRKGLLKLLSKEILKFGWYALTGPLEQVLSLGGQPLLENCIISLTPANWLSGLPLSRFCGGLIENGTHVIDQKNAPCENGCLDALLRKGFKR